MWVGVGVGYVVGVWGYGWGMLVAKHIHMYCNLVCVI